MLVIGTAHVIIQFIRVLRFFHHPDRYPENSSVGYFENVADPLFIAKSVLYGIQTLLGDSVIIWRCYIVYDKRLILVALPLLFTIPALIAGVLILNIMSHLLRADLPDIVNDGQKGQFTKCLTIYFVMTLLINIYCTGAIIWRIYSTSRFQRFFGKLRPTVIILVESGALYTSSIIAYLCTYLSSPTSAGQWAALDIITPLVGIVFCLIILQAKFHPGSWALDTEPDFIDTTSPGVGHWNARGSLGNMGGVDVGSAPTTGRPRTSIALEFSIREPQKRDEREVDCGESSGHYSL